VYFFQFAIEGIGIVQTKKNIFRNKSGGKSAAGEFKHNFWPISARYKNITFG